MTRLVISTKFEEEIVSFKEIVKKNKSLLIPKFSNGPVQSVKNYPLYNYLDIIDALIGK